MANSSVAPRLPIPVVQYLRVSTEDQKYSTAIQAASIAKYAAANNLSIIKTFQDEARSGLSLAGRSGLQDLLATVGSANCNFLQVLVLDVSRWGRFQNADESAYYDFHCRMNGVQVVYVAEPYVNDTSPFATAFKAMKRAAAAEYSRELSVKVRAGQTDLVKRGFRVSAPVPFGLRKLVVNERMEPRMLLDVRDRKGLQSHHNVLVPGPAPEVALVKRIFRLYTQTDLTIPGITSILEREGVLNQFGDPLTYNWVGGILRQEAYLGRNVWGKRRWQLGARSSKAVPPSEWIRMENCFPAIVSARMFARARVKAAHRGQHPAATVSILLNDLDEGLRRGVRFKQTDLGVQTRYGFTPYYTNFGGINNAYALLGVDDGAWAARERMIRETRQTNLPTRNSVIDELMKLGYPIKRLRFSSGAEINGQLTVRICTATATRRFPDRWILSAEMSHGPEDLVIVVRMLGGQAIKDYLVVPPTGATVLPTWLNARSFPKLLEYREDDLSCLHFFVGALLNGVRSGEPQRTYCSVIRHTQ